MASAVHQLLSKATSGDRLALSELFLEHYDALSAHVAQRLPASVQGAVGVDDIIQETFTRVVRKIHTFQQNSDASFLAWLTTIAENQVKDAIRKQNAKRRRPERGWAVDLTDGRSSSLLDLAELVLDDGETPGAKFREEEIIRSIRVAIVGLPEQQRSAVQLHFVEGKTLGETADSMGCTTGAARGLIYRALTIHT